MVLREVRVADLPALYDMQAEPGWTEMAGIPRRDLRAWLDHRAAVSADPDLVWLAVEAGGELVGDVVCFPRDGHREVGYGIIRAHWGRGLATAALRLLLARIGERPLHAGVLASNHASRRVLERCGFVAVGAELYELRD